MKLAVLNSVEHCLVHCVQNLITGADLEGGGGGDEGAALFEVIYLTYIFIFILRCMFHHYHSEFCFIFRCMSKHTKR